MNSKKNKIKKYYKLKIVSIIKDTEIEASYIKFEVPEESKQLFEYQPGQFLTFKFFINNQEVSRSYSISNSSSTSILPTIGVKRIKEGLVSNYIYSNLKQGDTAEVLPPKGRFFIHSKKEKEMTYYCFASGSGISPILSIVESVLNDDYTCKVEMMYGNHTMKSAMFHTSLKTILKKYSARFNLIHCLSQPTGTDSNYPFKFGRINNELVLWFLKNHPPKRNTSEYYICGPGSMNKDVKKTLIEYGLSKSQIFTESYGVSTKEKDFKNKETKKIKLTAYLDNELVELEMEEGKTILETLLENDYEAPSSCRGGACATCMCKLLKGKVHMKNNVILTDGEVEEGFILACQSLPLTDEIEITYEY